MSDRYKGRKKPKNSSHNKTIIVKRRVEWGKNLNFYYNDHDLLDFFDGALCEWNEKERKNNDKKENKIEMSKL